MDIQSLLAMLQPAPVGALNDAAAPAPISPAPDAAPAPDLAATPGILEAIAQSMSGGRDQGQRAFYNATRNGIWSSEPAPADARRFDERGHELPGGLFSDLNTRRALQGYDAKAIEEAILGHLRSGGR